MYKPVGMRYVRPINDERTGAMYEWTAKSGVRVVSCKPRQTDSLLFALIAEYKRWYDRYKGRGK